MMDLLFTLHTYLSEHWLEISTTLLTFLWVYLEYKASMWLWPVGVILPIPWIIISWQDQFYGNVALNVYYFITSIIGWVMWLRKGDTATEEKPITHIPAAPLAGSVILAVIIMLPVYYILREQSSLPWADVVSTVVSVVGMIWLAKKWREHWFCWIIANTAGTIVFLHVENYVSAIAFLVNLCMSILGYRHWGRLMQEARK